MKNHANSCKLLSVIAVTLSIAACNSTTPANESNIEKAKRITQNTIIVDGHIDVPYRVEANWVDVTKATEKAILIILEPFKEA